MSNLDEAMLEQMAYIVLSEHRPFSLRDFLCFEVDGKEYTMTQGTFRNKISRLMKSGEVKLAYHSVTAFYTLKGHSFCKSMTPNHVGVNSSRNDPIIRLIQNLPMDKNAVHDIRLRFEAKGIWNTLSINHPELLVKQNSKDILIPTWNVDDDLLVRVTVHKTDTVSVSVGCSLAPVAAADINGVIRLSTALTRIEERLNELLKSSIGRSNNDNPGAVATNTRDDKNGQILKLQVPDHNHWIVTMWHFGADALVEYVGAKFSVTWEVGQRALVRAYTKIMKDKKTRIRLERQEYPNKTFPEAIEDKLNVQEGTLRHGCNKTQRHTIILELLPTG